MTDCADIVARVRASGANVMIDERKLIIVNKAKLPADVREQIRLNAAGIAAFLTGEAEFEERAAVMEYDGGLTRPAAEYLTRLLMSSPPRDMPAADWTWFCDKAAGIVERDAFRRAAA